MKLKLLWATGGCILALIIVTFLNRGYHDGPRSDHFDGSRFHNPEPGPGFLDHAKWIIGMDTVEWPDWIQDPPQPPPPARVDKGRLRATYINQSSVLVQVDRINILTDPFWSKRAGPTSWLGSKRIRAPGVRLSDLPLIDLVLISHDHYDHLDLPTLKTIVRDHSPTILVGLGVKKRLVSLGDTHIVELDWWDNYSYSSDLKITFVPARHGSGRSFLDGDRTLWGGYVLSGRYGNILFLGDTGYGSFVEELKNRFEDFRLAILPLGSYEPYWFMESQHMNPEAAVRMHRQLNVNTSMGVHFGTLAEHPQQALDAHEKDLSDALKTLGMPESEFMIPGFGEGRDF